jgi:hypothetical protein
MRPADHRHHLTVTEPSIARTAIGGFVLSDDRVRLCAARITIVRADPRLVRFGRAEVGRFWRALKDVLRVLGHWPKDRYLELCPHAFAATRARLNPIELAKEVGPLTVPPPIISPPV